VSKKSACQKLPPSSGTLAGTARRRSFERAPRSMETLRLIQYRTGNGRSALDRCETCQATAPVFGIKLIFTVNFDDKELSLGLITNLLS
jgi:hypothetical protein